MGETVKFLAYQQALECIQIVVSQRKWDDLVPKTVCLNTAKNELQSYLKSCEMNDDLRHQLEHLSIKHRRVMRQLSEQMHQTEEDLNHVNEGLRHIHRVQDFSLSL
ncbi:MAG: hypothetical protein COA61_002915 [Zetaproteobacteria bacterium]|nr:hypothetical protein [Zetaproteobacteria bacterium]